MDLIVFGTVFLEVVFGDMPALPGPGQEIFTDQFAFSVGGAAVTAASAASGLGARAGMSALLGDDLGSRMAEQHCRRAGVDMTPCRYVTGPVTGVSVAVNFGGDRAFISHLPPRPAGERRDTRRWLDVLREHRPRWCYVHAGPGVAPFVRQARSLGVHVALACTGSIPSVTRVVFPGVATTAPSAPRVTTTQGHHLVAAVIASASEAAAVS